ncbi:MAG TPA: hypothetical protein VEY67_02745 [Candidatus Dormibacteraeota bacterium]|nr:hypothetical protein [Candidatus Dormibacteraeota bacterium]
MSGPDDPRRGRRLARIRLLRTSAEQGEPSTEPAGTPEAPGVTPLTAATARPTRPVTRARRRIDRSIRLLVFADLALIVGLVALFALALTSYLPTAGHPAQASPSPQTSPSTGLMTMGLAHIPTNSPCVLCHESGGSSGLKVIPAITHPLEGWRQCLSCHSRETLDLQAPGHVGIAETECLNCHKEAVEGPAITQPHAQLQDQKCLHCHGAVAHLPSSMASMKETECTWCHKPTTLPPPEYPHAPDLTTGCRTCHQSPEVGKLPVSHALYPDTSCMLCHLLKRGGGATPAASPAASLPVPSVRLESPPAPSASG